MDELFAFMTVYFSALILATTIRTIKAWLPTILGTGINGG